MLVVLATAAVLYVRYLQQDTEPVDPDPDVLRVIRSVPPGH